MDLLRNFEGLDKYKPRFFSSPFIYMFWAELSIDDLALHKCKGLLSKIPNGVIQSCVRLKLGLLDG